MPFLSLSELSYQQSLQGIAGNHPLRGVNDDSIGPRFPAVSDAYDAELQDIALKCAKELDLTVCTSNPIRSLLIPVLTN